LEGVEQQALTVTETAVRKIGVRMEISSFS